MTTASQLIHAVRVKLDARGDRDLADDLDLAETLARRAERFMDETVAEAQADELARFDGVRDGRVIVLPAARRRVS